MQQSAGRHYKKTTLEGRKEPAQGGEAASGPQSMEGQSRTNESRKREIEREREIKRNGADGEAAWKLEMEADWK